jgi:hypothetical protein
MFASRQSSKPTYPKWFVSAAVVAVCLTAWSGPAWAYRPFDGTDAAVAAPGEVEIELQPAGRLREGVSCVYRKLDPNVLMMKSAKDGVRTYDAGSLNRTRDRRILV